jgi:hypothetical protein
VATSGANSVKRKFNFGERRHDDVRRFSLPRTPVNKSVVGNLAQGNAKFYSLDCGGGVCSCSTTGLCSCSTTSSLTCSRPTSSSSMSKCWILPRFTVSARMPGRLSPLLPPRSRRPLKRPGLSTPALWPPARTPLAPRTWAAPPALLCASCALPSPSRSAWRKPQGPPLSITSTMLSSDALCELPRTPSRRSSEKMPTRQ